MECGAARVKAAAARPPTMGTARATPATAGQGTTTGKPPGWADKKAVAGTKPAGTASRPAIPASRAVLAAASRRRMPGPAPTAARARASWRLSAATSATAVPTMARPATAVPTRTTVRAVEASKLPPWTTTSRPFAAASRRAPVTWASVRAPEARTSQAEVLTPKPRRAATSAETR